VMSRDIPDDPNLHHGSGCAEGPAKSIRGGACGGAPLGFDNEVPAMPSRHDVRSTLCSGGAARDYPALRLEFVADGVNHLVLSDHLRSFAQRGGSQATHRGLHDAAAREHARPRVVRLLKVHPHLAGLSTTWPCSHRFAEPAAVPMPGLAQGYGVTDR